MPPSPHQQAVAVYAALLGAWNRQDVPAFAELFTPTGHVTGFDGSQMSGPDDIATQLGAIFGHHPTAASVAKVREVQPLVLQNTPAAFHGRPQLAADMTEELIRVYDAGQRVAES